MRRDPKRLVLKGRATSAVDDGVRLVATHRCRRHGPTVATLFIAQIHHLARRIAHGVIVPRCETKELAALDPGAPGAALAHEEPAVRVRDDIRPRGRGHAVAPHADETIAVGGDPAKAIIKAKGLVRRRRPTRRSLGRAVVPTVA